MSAFVNVNGVITDAAHARRLPAMMNVVLSGADTRKRETIGVPGCARYYAAPLAIVVSTSNAVAAFQMIAECGAGTGASTGGATTASDRIS